MSSKKQKPQPPSEMERMQASIGLAEYKIFKNLYMGSDNSPGPLLQMRDQAIKEDFTNLCVGRSGADIQQSLGQRRGGTTGQARYGATLSMGAQELVGEALTKGAGKAAANALKTKAEQQTKVLAAARKQAASTQDSISEAATIDANLALAKFDANVKRRADMMGIATQVVGAVGSKVAESRAYKKEQALLDRKEAQFKQKYGLTEGGPDAGLAMGGK